MNAIKILAVDVCGTLFDENTTAGFVRYHFKYFCEHTPKKLRLLDALRMPLLRQITIIIGLTSGRDYFRSGYISLLRGERKDRLDHSASHYAASLEEKRIAKVWRRIADLRRDEWKPVLVSNSLDIVVSAIAKRLGWDWVASELSFSGGRCDGYLRNDLRGRKARRLEDCLAEVYDDYRLAVVTDNASDADLIERSEKAYLVSKRKSQSWMIGENVELILY